MLFIYGQSLGREVPPKSMVASQCVLDLIS